MVAPAYFIEKSYSYYAIRKKSFLSNTYVVESPETAAEKQFEQLFAEGKAFLFKEEYSLALDRFKELQLLILKSVNPQLPSNPALFDRITFTTDVALLKPLMERAGSILAKTPVPVYNCPTFAMNNEITVPATIQKELAPLADRGFKVTSQHRKVEVLLQESQSAVLNKDYKSAIERYKTAIKLTPDTDKTFKASLMRDLKVLNENPDVLLNDTGLNAPKELSGIQKDRVLYIQGIEKAEKIEISANKTANLQGFYNNLAETADLGILQGYGMSAIQMVAYIPHLYFFVLPMAVGDCYKGLGDLKTANNLYMDTLKYPYINKTVEIYKVWTRLAEVAIEMGDRAYREAGDNHAQAFSAARPFYERILKSDGTLDAASPLYQDSKFNVVKNRISAFLSADLVAIGGVRNFNDNPQLLALTLEARKKLYQLGAKLNFFGIAADYTPPFSFEYLQNTARYFAQHASQIEEKYIQFKSTAENEELRFDQMSQQVELAEQTVILESRGVAEAQAGIRVSEENIAYTNVQIDNARTARDEFDDVRWELLEISQAEAWANASAVDDDDQVKLSWNGNYYNSSKKRRNKVLADLASQRTQITYELEASKLQSAVESAEAYREVAEAQLQQAQARKAIAEQRVEIAWLQVKHAKENRDFLDLKEFGASLWYDMAQTLKQIARKYLDMATEISVLMQRAYNAETERGLEAIRYNYSLPYMQGLLGADQLLRDIDYFSYDYITNIKSKKAPIKKTISIGDRFPNALMRLVNSGKCLFKTELSDFDRDYPGMYLCKIKNVELVFVGITKATSIAGTLRNTGVSVFRNEQGDRVSRMYPADVMPLSQYDMRQDALAFRFDPKDLKLFENNGIETIWELHMGRDANDFNFQEILDIQLVLYYDGFFNSQLEKSVRDSLPANGAASKAFSFRLLYPDELFYLKNNGEAVMELSEEQFPYNQTDLAWKTIRMLVKGERAPIKGLKIRLQSAGLGQELLLTTDDKGIVQQNQFNALKDQRLFDTWTIRIVAEDNPDLVEDGKLQLSGIVDVLFMTGYTFIYQS